MWVLVRILGTDLLYPLVRHHATTCNKYRAQHSACCGCASAAAVLTAVAGCATRSAASINFAMDTWLGYIIGIGTIINAAFNFWVIMFHPGFKAAGISASDDPYSTYTGGDDVRSHGHAAAFMDGAPTHSRSDVPTGNESVFAQPPAACTEGAESRCLCGPAKPRSCRPGTRMHDCAATLSLCSLPPHAGGNRGCVCLRQCITQAVVVRSLGQPV